MSGKSALCALAVIVLMGATAVAALAEAPVRQAYGPADSSVWNDSGSSQANAQSSQPQEDSFAFREAMETGALPGQPVALSEDHSNPSGDAPTVEAGEIPFRTDIDVGP